MKIFRRHPLARRNYLAKMLEILHGAPLGDSAWVSRGYFRYSTWGPRNGVPLGVPWGVKNHKLFCFRFFNFFFAKMGPWTSQ